MILYIYIYIYIYHDTIYICIYIMIHAHTHTSQQSEEDIASPIQGVILLTHGRLLLHKKKIETYFFFKSQRGVCARPPHRDHAACAAPRMWARVVNKNPDSARTGVSAIESWRRV